jgi:hypothetical protein
MYNRGQGRTGPGPVATDAMLHPHSLPSFLIPYSPAPPPTSLLSAGRLPGGARRPSRRARGERRESSRGERVRVVGRGERVRVWGGERACPRGAPVRHSVCASATPHTCVRRCMRLWDAARMWSPHTQGVSSACLACAWSRHDARGADARVTRCASGASGVEPRKHPSTTRGARAPPEAPPEHRPRARASPSGAAGGARVLRCGCASDEAQLTRSDAQLTLCAAIVPA